MGFTAGLTEEHRLILRMIAVIEKACDLLEKGEAIPRQLFIEAIEFVRGFADRFHHAKEEDILFVKLIENGMSEKGSPIEAMLIEHDQGRSFIRGALDAIAGFGEAEKVPLLTENLEAYARLLKEHIDKEDNVLYPLSERILPAEWQESALAAFRIAEQNLGGEKTLRHYEEIVEKYEKALATASV